MKVAKTKPTIHFDTESELRIAQQDFRQLREQAGWKRIQDFLRNSLDYYRRQLEEGDIKHINELYRLREKIFITEQLMNLPDIIIAMIERNESKVSFDPYEDQGVDYPSEADPYAEPKKNG